MSKDTINTFQMTNDFKNLLSDALLKFNGVTNDIINEIEEIKALLNTMSPLKDQPVNRIRWVNIEDVSPNDYNPNSVAKIEMGLLYTSIKHDGGFHRYFTCLTNKDILERNHGRVPIVVIEKDINDRMASTVRHNRARGKHSVTGMGNMVFEMLQNGWKDEEICNELGMQPEEILKLKHITGFSKLFQDTQYKQSWETLNQLRLKKVYKDEVH